MTSVIQEHNEHIDQEECPWEDIETLTANGISAVSVPHNFIAIFKINFVSICRLTWRSSKMPEFKLLLLWPCIPEKCDRQIEKQPQITIDIWIIFCLLQLIYFFEVLVQCQGIFWCKSRQIVSILNSIFQRFKAKMLHQWINDVQCRLEVARSKRVILNSPFLVLQFLPKLVTCNLRVLALWLVSRLWPRDRGATEKHVARLVKLNFVDPESSKFHVDPKLWTLFWEGALKLLASQRCMESFEPEKRKSATRCAWHRSSL